MTKTPENEIKAGIRKTLKFHGWFVQSNPQGMGCVKGRPDLEALKRGICIWIEAKAPNGRLSEMQQKYIQQLREAGAVVFVVNDVGRFLCELEDLQERLWPGQNLKRLC